MKRKRLKAGMKVVVVFGPHNTNTTAWLSHYDFNARCWYFKKPCEVKSAKSANIHPYGKPEPYLTDAQWGWIPLE